MAGSYFLHRQYFAHIEHACPEAVEKSVKKAGLRPQCYDCGPRCLACSIAISLTCASVLAPEAPSMAEPQFPALASWRRQFALHVRKLRILP
jgi:hypothetical protein